MKRKAILLSLLLTLVFTAAAQAMSSTNFSLDWMIPLTSGGGGDATSTHYSIAYSVGQTVVGEQTSTHYTTRLGFWQVFLRYIRLPIILKSG